MENEENKYLLTLEEGENVELKECAEKIPLSFYESYSAMANGSGGYIYLGITENKPENIIGGVTNAVQKKTQLCNTLTLKSKIANAAFRSDDIEIIKFGDKSVLKVRVTPVPIDQRPVYLDGDPYLAYKRVHEGDKKLEDYEIQAMINDGSRLKFDQKPNEFGFGIEDLDESALRSFIDACKRSKKIPYVEQMSDIEILNRIAATSFDSAKEKLVMTNGAILFLGKSYAINSIAPSLWLDYQEKVSPDQRFVHRIINRDLAHEPNIYTFYQSVFNRLGEVLPSPFYHKDGRNQGGELLILVVREALANALSNLELCSPMGMSIIKYPMSLSLVNAGGVLTGVEQALKGGVSIPRNPSIFNFFLAIGVSDHGGYGVPAIFDRTRELGMIDPIFKESWNRDQTFLTICFVQKAASQIPEEAKVLDVIALHPSGVSSFGIASELGISVESARQLLLRLSSQGLISDNGKARKGRLYFLAQKKS